MRNLRGKVAIAALAAAIPCTGMMSFGAASAPVPVSHRRDAASASAKPSEHAKVLHLLDRMTFGPRPGQVQAVEAMGMERWLNLQLHPQKIDDSALDQRLSEYQAPFMSPQELMLRFPPRNLIRQALKSRIAVPRNESERAVWENQMAIVRQRQIEKQAQAGQQTAGEPSMQPAASGNMMAASANQPPNQPGDMMPPPPIDEQSTSANIDATSLLDLGPQQRFEQLLKMEPGQFPELVRSMPPRERPELIAGMTPQQRETTVALVNPRMVVVNETESVRLERDIYSQRQLEQVMTEFWLNHFNIFTNKNEVEPYYLAQFENEVIAPHALGKFEDLLDAVAHSPAMLIYLDNVQSIGPDSIAALRREYPRMPRFELAQMMDSDARAMRGPVPPQFHNKPHSGINENYGRELMELHTVGVNGGYTQQDVIEAARVLTGWTVAPPRQGGDFRFDANRHEPGDKIVMGHRIKNGGENEGLELLHILATSPSTAHFISRELAVRFVSDNPSQALVDRMAKTFLSTHGNIGKVLKTMIDSHEFWSAPDTGNKIKTPLDYVVSAARATDADVTQPYRLVSALKTMGMPLIGTQQPNGYSMTNDAWTSSSELISRMNFALALALNRIPGVTVSVDGLLGPDSAGSSSDQQEAWLEQAILHGPAPQRMHEAILQALSEANGQTRAAAGIVLAGDGGGNPFAAGRQRPSAQTENLQEEVMTGLMLGSPMFQRR